MPSHVHQTIILVRFFELAVRLSCLSEQIFTQITYQPIQTAFNTYFGLDILTQMALLDFLPLFTKLPWTAQLVAPFLQQLFDKQVDLIEPNLVILASNVHAEDPTCFNILQNNYLKALESTMN